VRTGRILWVLTLSLALVFSQAGLVQAARGVPGSQEFGYGARLELNGPNFEDALTMTADLSLDWLALTVHWSDLPTENYKLPAWSRLDQAMQFAGQHRIPVLVSIVSPPPAAITKSGPNPSMTTGLVQTLVRRYPGILKAVELFPGANLTENWGAAPDPQAYAVLYQTVQAKINSEDASLLLVAGGLIPLTQSQANGMDDLVFLKGLYKSSAGRSIPVISIQLTNLVGDPLAPTGGTAGPVLRHYEEIRKIMVSMGREKDLIWISSFSSPSGKMNPSGLSNQEIQDQANWLFQAFTQLRSQLYIGVTIYQSLNPSPTANSSHSSLLLKNQQYHPFYKIFRDLILQNAPDSSLPQYGRPKNQALDKRKT
jgi:hypothetical protein